MIQMPVGVELADVPLNVLPMVDQTDGFTREQALVFTDFNTAVGELIWNFVTSAGVQTATVVTAVTGTTGNYHITHKDGGMYTTLIPASGGASINNDALGYGWFSGKAQGALPFCGPIIAFGLDIAVNTTISALSSQTSFTLAAGSTDTNAYRGWLAVVRDAAGTAQRALGVISAYSSGRVVTLDADPGIYTMAIGDYVTLLPQVHGLSVQQAAGVAAELVTYDALTPADLSSYFGAQIDDDVNDASAAANTFAVTTTQSSKILVGVLRFTSGSLSGEARLVHWTGTTIETLDPDSIPAGLGEGGPFSAAPADNDLFTFIPLS